MRSHDVSKEFVDLLSELVNGLIKKSNIPRVIPCIIVSPLGNEKYTVSRNGEKYTVKSRNAFSPGDTVEVMLPDGRWNHAFIIY